jgi:hypothetical protein
MKLLRYALALLTMCALSGMGQAHAFKLGILDAPPSEIEFTGAPLTGLMFASCGGGSTDGCITIENDTGHMITSLQLEFSATGLTTSGGCDSTGTSIAFTNCSFSETTGSNPQYVFDFSGGPGIGFMEGDDGGGNTFTIQVTGEPYTDFGPLTLTSTPEPSSIVLLSTGGLLLGAFFYYKRRNGLGEMGL